MTEEVFDDMGFLIQELHKEWERTGAVKAAVWFTGDELAELMRKTSVQIKKAVEGMNADEMSFRQYILKSKECSILLRFARKIKALETAGSSVEQRVYSICFDNEEWKIYKEIF